MIIIIINIIIIIILVFDVVFGRQCVFQSCCNSGSLVCCEAQFLSYSQEAFFLY